MDIFEGQAKSIERAAQWLAHSIGATAVDRLDWKPKADEKSDTMNVREIATQVIGGNYMIAGVLKGEAPSRGDGPAPATAEDAQRMVLESAKSVADVVRSADPAILGKVFETPMGQLPGVALMQMPAIHMDYHNGQINLIQRLYGDVEMHFPAR